GDKPKIAGLVHFYIIHLQQERRRQQSKAFIVLIISIKPLVRTRPKDMVIIHIKTVDEIVADAGTVFRIVAKHLEGISVEPIQSILRAEPKESLIVLYTRKHRIVRQPVLYLVVPEVI